MGLDISNISDLNYDPDLDFTPYSTPLKEDGSRSGSRDHELDQRTPTNSTDVVRNLNKKFSDVAE